MQRSQEFPDLLVSLLPEWPELTGRREASSSLNLLFIVWVCVASAGLEEKMFWELLIRYSSLDRQLEINLSFFSLLQKFKIMTLPQKNAFLLLGKWQTSPLNCFLSWQL